MANIIFHLLKTNSSLFNEALLFCAIYLLAFDHAAKFHYIDRVWGYRGFHGFCLTPVHSLSF